METDMAAPKRKASEPAPKPERPERVYGMPLRDEIHYYRRKVGLMSHQALADAAARHLPDYVGMNRRMIQGIETGEYSLGNGVNELQMIAIARACMIPPSWLGVDISADLQRIEALIRSLSWPDGGDGREPEDGTIPFRRRASDVDLHERDKRCIPVLAGQVA